MTLDNMENRPVSCREFYFEQSNDKDENCDIGNQSDLNNMNCGMDVDKIHSFMSNDMIPVVGMEFDSEEKAWEFYLAYAKQVGFGVRKSKSHNDKYGNLIARTFCCNAQGKRENDKRNVKVKSHRAETRFGCQARMRLHTRHSKKFHLIEFVQEHNHYLSSPSPRKTHLHRSNRKVTHVLAADTEMVNNVGIAPKATHELLARQAGGRENIGLIPEDYKNYLRSKRTRDAKTGDMGGVLEYLHKKQFEDPNFFYAIQVDEDDLITNIFWSDAKMRTDFSNFGDVVCFDTTYHKDNEGRPIALFVGVNHHKQTVIFGAALLYDDTALTFEWLFDTFTKAMSGEKPKTILTDQDAAMANAISSRWPETNHRLCIWQIYQNAANHLSNVFANSKGFSLDFSRCIYDIEEEDEFIEEWDKMQQKHGLNNNEWLKRMFHIREKWALVYGRQMFCADMATTQRSESMNIVLKRYVNYKYKFLEFFDHFERLIEDRRYNELKADFKANISFPPLKYPCELLKNAASVYTPEVFECFEKEWCKSLDSSCHDYGEVGSSMKYAITPLGKHYHHTVLCDSLNKFECTCRKFEFGGILCSHILKVFSLRNVLTIPSEYVLKRWTRMAKTGYSGVEESFKSKSNLDPKLLFSMRYKELCRLSLQLITKAAETDETYDIAKDGMLKMLEAVDTRLQVTESVDQVSKEKMIDLDENTMLIDEVSENVGGIKTKDKTSSGKRLKSGLERAPRKKKQTDKCLAKSMALRLPIASCAENMKENLQSAPFLHVTESEMPYNHEVVTQRDFMNLVNPTPAQSDWCTQSSEIMEDNFHATPFIPNTEYQLSNYHEQMRQVVPQKDLRNLVNYTLSQSDWCAHSSQIRLNQQPNLVACSAKETSCSMSMTKLLETQPSQILHQCNMINMPDIDVSARTTFVDSDAAIVGIRCSRDCGCPTPCEDGWCKNLNKKVDSRLGMSNPF